MHKSLTVQSRGRAKFNKRERDRGTATGGGGVCRTPDVSN